MCAKDLMFINGILKFPLLLKEFTENIAAASNFFQFTFTFGLAFDFDKFCTKKNIMNNYSSPKF